MISPGPPRDFSGVLGIVSWSLEWSKIRDARKRVKDGVGFIEAQRAFRDRWRVIALDEAHTVRRSLATSAPEGRAGELSCPAYFLIRLLRLTSRDIAARRSAWWTVAEGDDGDVGEAGFEEHCFHVLRLPGAGSPDEADQGGAPVRPIDGEEGHAAGA